MQPIHRQAGGQDERLFDPDQGEEYYQVDPRIEPFGAFPLLQAGTEGYSLAGNSSFLASLPDDPSHRLHLTGSLQDVAPLPLIEHMDVIGYADDEVHSAKEQLDEEGLAAEASIGHQDSLPTHGG